MSKNPNNQEGNLQANGKTLAENTRLAQERKGISANMSHSKGGRRYDGDIDRSYDSPMQDWAETSEDL